MAKHQVDRSVPVVLDTNVFVGAAFKPESASGEIVQAVRDRRLRMPWTDATREEVETVLRKIPPISWADFEELFRREDRFENQLDAIGETGLHERDLDWIPDPTDRKFAALARAAEAILVSSDHHLLQGRSHAGFPIWTPGQYRELMGS